MNIETVFQVMGSIGKALGNGAWSGRIWALWLAHSLFLNCYLLLRYLFTHTLCCYWEEKTWHWGERWSSVEVRRPWGSILRCGWGPKGARPTTGSEVKALLLGFAAEENRLLSLGRTDWSGVLSMRKALQNQKPTLLSLLYTHSHPHPLHFRCFSAVGSTQRLGIPFQWLLLLKQVDQSAPLV